MNLKFLAFPCALLGMALLAPGLSAQTAPVFANLINFDDPNTPGLLPAGGLIEGPDGYLYGTLDGGSNGGGIVFRMTRDGQQATELHGFVSNSSYAPSSPDGLGPNGTMLFARDGNLYGQTLSTLFRLSPDGNLTTLHTFQGADGGVALGPLVEGNDGYLYGITREGDYRPATIFRMTPAGQFTVLYTFQYYDPAGSNPRAGLLLSSDGNFYGATSSGGFAPDGVSHSAGCVFKITPEGALTVLHTFIGSDGSTPYTNLVEGPDGNLYGTTQVGGSNNTGTVYRITPDGELTTLRSFDASDNRLHNVGGRNPQGRFILGKDGNFYGATYTGGTYGAGVVFRVTPGGVLTSLHDFTALTDPEPNNHANHSLVNADGYQPFYGVSQASDGNLYGTTSLGGTMGIGVAFRVDPGTTGLPSEFAPRLDGPTLLGATVGEPFAYRITATNRPTAFTAANLPPGTNFDPASGLIAGVIPTAGTYLVNLGAASVYGAGGAVLTLVVTPPRPALELRAFVPQASFSNGQSGLFAVYLSETTTADLTVNYTLTGSAVNGADYRRLSGTLTIPAGESYGVVAVVPKAHLRGEGVRHVLMRLAPGDGYSIRTRAAASVRATFR